MYCFVCLASLTVFLELSTVNAHEWLPIYASHTLVYLYTVYFRRQIKSYLLIYTAPLLSSKTAAPYNAFQCGILTSLALSALIATVCPCGQHRHPSQENESDDHSPIALNKMKQGTVELNTFHCST